MRLIAVLSNIVWVDSKRISQQVRLSKDGHYEQHRHKEG
jgi:hypothetical protein